MKHWQSSTHVNDLMSLNGSVENCYACVLHVPTRPWILFSACLFLQVFNKLLSLASTACESKDHNTWSHLLLSVPGVSSHGWWLVVASMLLQLYCSRYKHDSIHSSYLSVPTSSSPYIVSPLPCLPPPFCTHCMCITLSLPAPIPFLFPLISFFSYLISHPPPPCS